MLIDGSMFHIGFNCYSFAVADKDEVYLVDATEQIIQDFKEVIQGRMLDDHSHIDISQYGIQMRISGKIIDVLEIQWG